MTDRVTANLPAIELAETAQFYAALGFAEGFRDSGWMILQRGDLNIEFFPHPDLKPPESWFSACVRVDDLDALYADFTKAGLSAQTTDIPRMTPIETMSFGARMFALIDCNGSLLRCFDNGSFA